MADYQHMYSVLFNKITDVIEQLQELQNRTEELFVHSHEPQLIELKKWNDKTNPENHYEEELSE
jgi:phosphohistidine phosphatase SixA